MALPPSRSSRRGLAADESADAAVMAAACAGLTIVSSIVPHATFLQVCALVPFGVVTYRHRPRALVAAFVAAAVVSALVVGIGSLLELAVCALVGGLVGGLKRRGRGPVAVALSAAGLAPALAGLADLALWIFASYRRLVLASLTSTFRGIDRVCAHLGPLRPLGHAIQRATGTAIDHWPITVAGVVMIAVPVFVFAAWVLIGEVIDRLTWVRTANVYAAGDRSAADSVSGSVSVSVSDDSVGPAVGADAMEPAPLPVRLRGVIVRYGETEALGGLDLDLALGEFVAVVGDNGSGKSTLARLLAGAPPSAGTVDRAGPVGLGRRGGTALILQRPDAQVVGLRVRDDVLWGLPPDVAVDVDGLLATVGLAGMAGRDTATLSGGQLQRLAVASALARRPQLLISDEATAMVDPAGRRELIAVLAELPRRWPMTVVHVTHNRDELAAADRVVRLDGGRVAPDLDPTAARTLEASRGHFAAAVPAAEPGSTQTGGPGEPAVSLTDVGHDYAHGTPWEHPALDGVSLSVGAGEGVLIVGDNGSGKSTLAWIVAGLLAPTYGICLVHGQPAHRRRGVAAPIAFQHARLQLQRPFVGEDIADAAGWLVHVDSRENQRAALAGELRGRVAGALAAVGLDPELATRSIEHLSGGQQRRVAVAGLLARNPRVLVLDEPLAGLDAPTRTGLITLLGELRERAGLTLIVVTHDPDQLASVCPRTVTLSAGRVLADTGVVTPARPLVGEAA